MRNSHDHNDSEAPSEFHLEVPAGDDARTSEHLVQTAVALLTRALTEITELLDTYGARAPESARRVTDLATIVATSTVTWLRCWPQPDSAPLRLARRR
ncbi:hypothetical protein H0264_35610 [Nocardia huaxiensis]|uniref:Uncharacterized protein n=1 Tax=Nocardia huaxiensis TaxID=2755382 RepID=A0A7D6VAG8_9NOCA|nr:hypothetical protein [Nocardia huaxiensis]QLY30393.1 hypothetical protein H0264_35610 [Nocardia huaxiensis]